MKADSGWAVVTGSVVMGSLDEIGVVASSFDNAGVGSMPSTFCASFGDFGEGFAEGFSSAVRGKSPLVR